MVDELRFIKMFKTLHSKTRGSQFEDQLDEIVKVEGVIEKVFEELYAINKSKESVFIIVYLPTERDYLE
jgi:hypothetical protein